MESYYIILIATISYCFFMGTPYLRWMWDQFDYGHHTFRVSLWYLCGTILLLLTTNVGVLFTTSGLLSTASLGIGVIVLMFVFSGFWQTHGKPLMPNTTAFRPEVTTHYHFTPTYAFSKAMEIAFQDVCAAAMIIGLYAISGEQMFLTGALFAILFLAIHLPIAFWFYGREWLMFLCAGSILVGIIPTVIILSMPSGLPVLFSFHVLMYLGFFIILRRLALRRVAS